jgi:putative transposase
MFDLFGLWFGAVLRILRTHRSLMLENLALRQQLAVLKRKAGFKLYWAMLCGVRKRVGGGRRISKQIRDLIFQMVAENPTWGAPRIHGELLMLGFQVSEATVTRWMRRAPRPPEPTERWTAFLRNHREAIAAMDFFTVPTLTFSVLYCFCLISHDRRRILHFNVTRHPTSSWIVQQLREAFP